MKFKYVGPFDAVDVPELGLVGVQRGHQVEAAGAVAESLSKQDSWQRVAPPKKAAPKTTSKKAASKPAPTPPVTGDKNEE